ncbi:MAG: SDR family oxidoreductase [Alphaproteobacteria bacterium]|nr:SDR family oxidoreductase [Alphaproteobacteria bacterium]
MTGSESARYRLDGLSAIVTGSGSGIGKATARMLAMAGAAVTVADRDGASAEEACSEIAAAGASASAVALDVTDEDAIENVFGSVVKQHGAIDILINNAGRAIRHPALELSIADWDKVVAVNQTAVFLCSRAAARRMITSGRGGAIVNTASIMGLSGGGLYPNISYQTTKGAVVNMTRALAVEWAPHGIRVNAVAPTYVNTPFIAPILAQPELVERIKQMTPLRKLAEPDDVAAAILFLASPAAAMITGHTLPVDGGFLAQ